jgi:hypothetical protein
VVESV